MSMPSVTTVVGSGTMGPGIASVFARAGSEVRIYDISEEALERARTSVALCETVLNGLGGEKVGNGSISFEIDLEKALKGTKFVLEAVPEKIEIKKSVLAEIEKYVGDDVIIASTTSGIPISDLAVSIVKSSRFIGMHWSNPPHLIPLIEVVPGEKTSDATRDELVKISHAFGYEGVVEKDIPGFAENRILYAILRECLSMVEDGVISQKDLDICVRWGIGYKLAVVGPMRLLDMAGLDIYNNVAGYLNPDLSNQKDISKFITDRVAAGRLGMKTGAGIFDYAEGEVAAKRAEIVKGLVAVRKALPAPLSQNQI
ncbi:MAG: 3-hydroxyacyl-CoA dehydrogenase NAD-binding domain-containing protein [Actinomycetes bacterium]|jgi:3-hydroxyacyl-CoA dehydrogenase